MEERKMFGFDVRDIDWESYIIKVHLQGIKRVVFGGRSAKENDLKDNFQ